ncbi:MAG: hypothetical protein JWL80_433 [Parcubacteria group bacterium]|nr:hypothetical protein [Parcubacteria group bacterium]
MEQLKTISEKDHKAIIGALVFICLLVFLGIKFHSIQETPIRTPAISTEPFSENIYTYKKGNFQLSIFPGWTATTTLATFPYTDSPAIFSLQRDSGCKMVYGNYTEPGQKMIQTSFGDRIFTQDNEQLDPQISAPVLNVPEDFKFDYDHRQSFSGEVIVYNYRLVYPNYGSNAFSIFNPEGGKIGYNCIKEVNNMLSSLKGVYEAITLDATSKGVVFFREDTAMFIGDDEIPKTIMKMPPGYFPALIGNTLYRISGGRLYTLDIFNKSFSEIPLKGITSTSSDLATFDIGTNILNSYYFIGDDLYYLVGPNCQVFKAKCDLALRVKNMKTGVDRLLQSHVSDGHFLGYKPEEHTLYLGYQDGDAGYGWGQVDTYNIQTNVFVSLGQYEIQADDPTPNKRADLISLIYSFDETRTYEPGEHVPELHVENGMLKKY